MKLKFITACMGLVLSVGAYSSIKEVSTNAESQGYHVEEIINDKFNKDQLDSSWTTVDSTLDKKYNALHCISPVTYGYGVVMNGWHLDDKTRLEFTIYPNSGDSASNISFMIGASNFSDPIKEGFVDAKVMWWDDQFVFADWQNNLNIPSGQEANYVRRGFSDLFSELVATDVALIVTRKSETVTEIYTEYSRNGELVWSTANEPFRLNNPRQPYGYCGFFWDVVEMDLTNFKVYNNDDLVFEDKFEENTLTYQATDASLGNFHVNGVLTEANVFVSQVSSVKLDKANSSLTHSYKLTERENVTKAYEMQYDIAINELNDGSLVGFGLGMGDDETKIDARNAIGLLKHDSNNVEVVAIRDGKVDRTNNYQLGMLNLSLGKFQTVKISIDSLHNVVFTIAGISYKFSNIEYIGRFGVGNIDLGCSKSSDFEVKYFVLSGNTYKKYAGDDASNDFSGSRAGDADGFDEPYINNLKYFLGPNVTLDEDWGTGERSIVFSSANPYSSFGVRQQFSEFVCEFDIEISSRQLNQFIGLAFGRESVVDVLMQASTTTKAMMFICGTNASYTDIGAYGAGVTFDDGSNWKKFETNLFEEGHEKWHFMFIGKDRSVSFYCKEADAPDSDLGICRARITNCNIDGYVSIVGNNSATFSITNYKIANLSDECKNSSILTVRESFDNGNAVDERLDIVKPTKVSDGKLSMNNSEISTVTDYLFEIIRFTTYSIDESIVVRFSNGKRITIDALNKEVVVFEDGIKTTYDALNIDSTFLNNLKGKRLELVILGDKLTLGCKGYYDPADKLSDVILTHTFASPLSSGSITIASNGKTTIDDLYIFALDNSTRCDYFDYEDDPNDFNIWEVKKDFDPSKVYDPNKKEPTEDKPNEEPEEGCKGSVAGISFIFAASLLGLVVSLKKRED